MSEVKLSYGDLVKLHWLDGLSVTEIGRRLGIGYRETRRQFEKLGVLRRHRRDAKLNRVRLELMLWPSVGEYKGETDN